LPGLGLPGQRFAAADSQLGQKRPEFPFAQRFGVPQLMEVNEGTDPTHLVLGYLCFRAADQQGSAEPIQQLGGLGRSGSGRWRDGVHGGFLPATDLDI
jgi:hypothetical protein